jgi:hypothetical protein
MENVCFQTQSLNNQTKWTSAPIFGKFSVFGIFNLFDKCRKRLKLIMIKQCPLLLNLSGNIIPKGQHSFNVIASTLL